MPGRVSELLDSQAFCASVERTLRDQIVWAARGTATESAVNEDVDGRRRHCRPLSCPAARSADPTNIRKYLDLPTIPIADWQFHEELAQKYSDTEIVLRNKLASLYRLADIFQWSQGIYNHITVRVSEREDDKTAEILINPFGMLYQEITASSLVKVDLAGNILDAGSANMSINQAGYVLHSAIHKVRPDVRCLIHLHTPVVAAVSAMKCGVLPISQEAMVAGPVAYYHYKGIVSLENECQAMTEALGDKNIMILHNHGFVSCGESIEDALHLTFNLILACQTQIRAVRSAGLENIIIPEAQAIARAYNLTRDAGGGGVIRLNDSAEKHSAGHSAQQWGIGELEWEAWMRVLDSAGHHTGHIYKMPQLKDWHNKRTEDQLTTDGYSHSRAHSSGILSKSQRLALLRMQRQREWRWVAPAHVYQRVERPETGADNPRVFIKWVQCESERSRSVGGTPIRIAAAHQFVPSGADAKTEFRSRQQALRQNSSHSTVSSGPLSQIVDRLAQNPLMQCYETNFRIYIGTASKGIIERDQQHNALVYRRLHSTNPFTSQTPADIDAYVAFVNARQNNGLLVPLDVEENEMPKSRSTPALESRLYEIGGNLTQPQRLPYSEIVENEIVSDTQHDNSQLRNEAEFLEDWRTAFTLPRAQTSSAKKERGLFAFMRRRKAANS